MKAQTLALFICIFLTLFSASIQVAGSQTYQSLNFQQQQPSQLHNFSMKGSENLNWIQAMTHEHDIPFSSLRNGLSRLGMLIEMGAKHPAVNCEEDCESNFNINRCLNHCETNSGIACPAACEQAKEAKAVACRLGLVGATYYLTQFQEITHRSKELIWHGPNASLNIEAYAYMKESEAGVSCRDSHFIRKFPTRSPLPGESRPPIQRVEVCAAWNDYFQAAGLGIRRTRPEFFRAYSSQSGLSYNQWLEENRKQDKEVNQIQATMWRAHTLAILHAYWQHLHGFKRSQQMRIPREEYRMWMGWNKLVGGIIPDLNLNSCAGNAEFLAYQLMPNCVVGQPLKNGGVCRGTPEPGAAVFGTLKSEIFHQMQLDRASEDFIEALEAFASPMEESRKIPYRWPSRMSEPFSFSRTQ